MPLPMFKKSSEIKRSIKTILAIAAGKGGVGKSTVTVHLGLALKEKGFRVGILDADLYGPSLRKMLKEDRPPSQKEGKFFPALSQGIEVMSMSYFRKQGEAAAVRAPIANGIITDFLNRVVWSPLDFLLIDFPPGTGDIQLTLCQKASIDASLLITTPQEVSLIDVQKCAHLFQELKVPIIGIVENMSYYTPPNSSEKIFLFGTSGGKQLAKDLGKPLLGQIPVEPLLSKSGDLGIPLNAEQKDHPVSLLFASLVDLIQIQLQTDAFRKTSLSIQEISKIDPYTFSILWNDGILKKYRLSTLQAKCPCAQCLETLPKLDPFVQAQQIQNVGRYGLKILFSSGCSHGIYDYSLLREGEWEC